MERNFTKILKWVLIFGVIATLIVLYKIFDPLKTGYFPKCPFRELTGYKCPGCGSQRAIHDLLNLEVSKAFQQNALLVISIPYLLVGFIFDIRKTHSERALKWRKILFGERTIYIILVIIILFWILRNIPYFQHWL